MIDLKYIINPAMGVIIGFGTNYVAVKMLFRPYKAFKIGKFTLPFTPGVIPKRRNDIAKALGDTISNELFTNNDIKEVLLTEEIKNKISDGIIQNMRNNDISLKDYLQRNIDEEKYNKTKINIENIISEKIVEGLLSINIAKIIATQGAQAVKESLSGSFFGSFISEDKIKSFAEPVGDKIEDYLKKDAKNLIIPYLDNEISDLENQSVDSLLNRLEMSDEKIKEIIEKIYTKIVEEKMQNIFDSLNISNVIQEKINAMDVKEIERLFMIVMKKELNAIINLGAVLGLILGLVNAFLL